MKKNKLALKFIAIFLIAITLSITIDFAFIMQQSNPIDIQEVQAAEQEGCCLDTGSTQCVTTTRTECLGKFYTGPPYDCSNVPECTPKTCVPTKDTSQACIRAKTVAECNSIGGVALSEDLDSIPQCQTGCCIIAQGMKAEVLQKRQCENLSIKLTNDINEMQFLPEIKSQVECKKMGSPNDIVCCVLGAGNCKYGFRSECSNSSGKAVPLQGGEYCRDVKECAVTSHVKPGCGIRTGTEFNIYWFDSQGNQEEPTENGDCDYPNGMCKIDPVNQTPYCAKTICDLPKLQDQVIPEDIINQKKSTQGRTTLIEVKNHSAQTLLTGTSKCYNFYSDFQDDSMYGRSTGLQNEILHCSLGTVEIQGLGPDRNLLCNEGNTTNPQELLHANEFNNSWQKCTQCGKGGLFPPLGNLIGPFPILGGSLGRVFAKVCTYETCKNLGDCVYINKFPGGTVDIGIIKPVVSCVPLYPPGTNSMTINSSQCSQCGGGTGINDAWNTCKQAECESLGDCQFTEHNPVVQGLIFLAILVGGYIIGRFVWMPIDCLVYTAFSPLPFGAAYQKCFTQVRPQNFYFKVISLPVTLVELIIKNPVIGAIIGFSGLALIPGLSQLSSLIGKK